MKDDLEILALAAPLRRQIETRLRSAITEGRFHAGDRLVERELCEMLGVSRPSLREAMRQLEAEELVTLRPNRGPIVADVTLEEAREIYEVRATLEGLAARLFVRNASEAEVAALRRAARDLKKAGADNTSELLLGLKDKYYEVLLAGCRNREISRTLTRFHNRLKLLRAKILAGRSTAALAEVAGIVDAIARRDEDAACTASIEHIDRAAEWAVRALQRRDAKPAAKPRGRKH